MTTRFVIFSALLLALGLTGCPAPGDDDRTGHTQAGASDGSGTNLGATSSLLLPPKPQPKVKKATVLPGVSQAPPAPDDHAPAQVHATPLALGDAGTGQLETVQDRDAFAVVLTAGQRYAFTVHAYGALTLTLRGPDGVVVATTTPGAKRIEHQAAVNGRYTLTVQTDVNAGLHYAVQSELLN